MKPTLGLGLALAALCIAPVYAVPKPVPSPPLDKQITREQIARLRAEIERMQAVLGQLTPEQKHARARARLKAQVRERRRQLTQVLA